MCNCRISQNGDGGIPNFQLMGNPNPPELLSNKIILTPPAPGNQRAALWADKTLEHTQWVADVDFRANGPERAGGNLNIWLVRDGPHTVGTSSIYTVGQWDGLALVVDTYGGGGGMVRGFLNDGDKDYSKISVDGQSFGHCQHSYRNLGRPSQIKFRQTASSFKVEIDGQLCFESDKISIPAGLRLGITAASADNPDSFEIFKMVVMTDNVDPAQDAPNGQKVMAQDAQQQQAGYFAGSEAQDPPRTKPRTGGKKWPEGNFESAFEEDIDDSDAATITSSKEQFEDLHTRIQSVNHHLSSIFKKLASAEIVGERRQEELATQIGGLKDVLLERMNKIDDLEKKLTSLENEVRRLKGDVTNKVTASERSIKGMVSDTHTTLHDAVKEHAGTGHTRLIAVIIGSQVVLVIGYVLYKRKKSTPKKYL